MPTHRSRRPGCSSGTPAGQVADSGRRRPEARDSRLARMSEADDPVRQVEVAGPARPVAHHVGDEPDALHLAFLVRLQCGVDLRDAQAPSARVMISCVGGE